jgi:micrococcal nuclease
VITGVFAVSALMLMAAPTFTGKVVGVSDGDTITVLRGHETVKIRLEGIDCPESGQDFGRRAKRFTSDLVFGKVTKSGGDVSLELVRAGLAWYFKRYSDDEQLAQAEEDARAEKQGLWQQPNATPPWEWRRTRR